jgi:hypothetical protein
MLYLELQSPDRPFLFQNVWGNSFIDKLSSTPCQKINTLHAILLSRKQVKTNEAPGDSVLFFFPWNGKMRKETVK